MTAGRTEIDHCADLIVVEYSGPAGETDGDHRNAFFFTPTLNPAGPENRWTEVTERLAPAV
jgi:hypothetical protein